MCYEYARIDAHRKERDVLKYAGRTRNSTRAESEADSFD